MGNVVRGQMNLAPAGATHDPTQITPPVALFIQNEDGSFTDLMTFINQTQAGGIAMVEQFEALEARVAVLED